MTNRTIRLGPGVCSDGETGARYFAALAFPGLQETEAREDAVCGWVGAYLHEANLVDHCDEPFEDPRLNDLVQLSPAWCREKTKTARRRLRDRSAAARAVRPWVRELLGLSPTAVPGVKKFTQRQIALRLCAGDPERAVNFQKRIWRLSRPVLHLAVAYDLMLCSWEASLSAHELDLAQASFIGELVELAALVQPLLCEDQRFGVNDEQILTLEWVP